MTITLPGWLNVQEWTAINWLIAAAIVQVVYGLITHHHSMAQVRKWEKHEADSMVTECMMCFFFRLFISIPAKIIALVVGTIAIIIVPFARDSL